MSIQINLSENEVNAVLQVLGNQPTSSGAWPLLVKIKVQAEEFIKEQAQAPIDDPEENPE